MKKLLILLMCLNLILSPLAIAADKNQSMAGDQFRSNSTPKNGGMGFYMSQVLSLGTAGIGVSIATSCKWSTKLPSLPIFLAGSLVYIGSELLGGKSQNQAHLKKMEDLKMVEEKMQLGGDVQRSTIETALKEEQDMLAFIKKRKMWMLAVTTVYTGAMVSAIIEKMQATSCTSTNAAGVGCFVSPLAGVAASDGVIPYSGANLAGCSAKQGFGMKNWVSKALVAAYSFGVGHAGGTALSRYGAMGLALGITMSELGDKVVVAYNSPKARIITFGASAALAGLVSKGLHDKQKVAEENVKKLEKYLANFDSNSQTGSGIATNAGSSNGAMSGNNGFNLNVGSKGKVRELPTGALPKHCWGQSASEAQYTEGACAKKLQVTRANFGKNMNVPTLSSVSNMASDMGQAVADGEMGRADVNAGQLAALAGRMDAVKENMLKQLAASGEGLNVKKEIENEIARMASEVNRGAAAQGASLASLGPSSSTATLTDTSLRDDEVPTVQPGPGTASVGLPATGISESSYNDVPSSESLAAEARDNIDSYVIDEQDISKKHETSIFEQLSNRYILNYTKFFKKKAVSEESPPENQ